MSEHDIEPYLQKEAPLIITEANWAQHFANLDAADVWRLPLRHCSGYPQTIRQVLNEEYRELYSDGVTGD